MREPPFMDALDDLRLQYEHCADKNRLWELVEMSKRFYARRFASEVGLKPDVADEVIDPYLTDRTRSAKLTRRARQALAYYAYYSELQHKISHFVAGNCAGEPSDAAATAFLESPYAVVHDLSQAYEELARLTWQVGGALNADVLASVRANLEQIRSRSPEMAALIALVRHMLSLNQRELIRGYQGKPEWTPTNIYTPNKAETNAVILACLKLTYPGNVPWSVTIPKYVLSVATTDLTNKIEPKDECGVVIAQKDGSVFVEWRLEVKADILGPGDPARAVAFAIKSDCLQEVQDHRTQHITFNRRGHDKPAPAAEVPEGPVSPEAMVPDPPPAQLDHKSLQQRLDTEVQRHFGQVRPEVNIDGRCGQYLWEVADGDAQIAERIIARVMENLLKDRWWYVSRPQIDDAVDQLVREDDSQGLIERHVSNKLCMHPLFQNGSQLLGPAVNMLDHIAEKDPYRRGMNFDDVVLGAYRGVRPQQAGMNLHLLLEALVESGLVTKNGSTYTISSELFARWARVRRGSIS